MSKSIWESLNTITESEKLNELFSKKIVWDGTGRPNLEAEQIEIKKGITVIPPGLFSNNTHLKECIMHEGLLEIGENAFSNCSSLTDLIIPTTVNKIGHDAFKGAGLKSISLPVEIAKVLVAEDPDNINGRKVISKSPYTAGSGPDNGPNKLAYRDIYSLGIDLNKTYVSVTGASWINSIESRKKVDVELENPEQQNQVQDQKQLNENTKVLKIKDGTKEVKKELTQKYLGVLELYIPASVEYIEDGAFANFKNLKLVVWADAGQKTKLGKQIFFNCISLPELKFPRNTPILSEGICGKCTALKKVFLPSGIQFIAKNAFVECDLNNIIFCYPKNIITKKYSKDGHFKKVDTTPIENDKINKANRIYTQFFVTDNKLKSKAIGKDKYNYKYVYFASEKLLNQCTEALDTELFYQLMESYLINDTKEKYTVMNVTNLSECLESYLKEGCFNQNNEKEIANINVWDKDFYSDWEDNQTDDNNEYYGIWSADGENGMSPDDVYPISVYYCTPEEIKEIVFDLNNQDPRSHIIYSYSKISEDQYNNFRFEDENYDYHNNIYESIKYPNGEIASDLDIEKALDYMYGEDRSVNHQDYSDEQIQKALNYYIKKMDGDPEPKQEALDEDSEEIVAYTPCDKN